MKVGNSCGPCVGRIKWTEDMIREWFIENDNQLLSIGKNCKYEIMVKFKCHCGKDGERVFPSLVRPIDKGFKICCSMCAKFNGFIIKLELVQLV